MNYESYMYLVNLAVKRVILCVEAINHLVLRLYKIKLMLAVLILQSNSTIYDQCLIIMVYLQ